MPDSSLENQPEEMKQERLRKDLIQPEALQLIPEAIARQYNIIPLEISGNVLKVAMSDPNDILAIEALTTRSQMRIEPKKADAEEIQDAIDFSYQSYEEIEKHISSISLDSDAAEGSIKLDTVSDAPVAHALTLIIDEALKARASDIHFEPQEGKLRVRYRIDGTLHDMLSLPLKTTNQLTSRIKILANMNIADKHRPQDGQFSVKTSKRRQAIDIRVGTIATVNGEMTTLRLLDKSRATKTLSELGFLPETQAKYEEMLRVPYGMILVSGPTGAGKTTTLYASINGLDSNGRNIVTVEDPVEYRFKNINQIQVNPRAGLTFASGLRSILRHDPDVILVGEIRDAETASIAIQSALTGHLVLSSIHANDAVGVIFRLLDLGVEPFLVASALIGVISQRMVRKTCPDCSKLIEVPTLERTTYENTLGETRSTFLCGSGCKSCSFTGYQGRTGIFEILNVSDDIRTMLISGATASEIRAQALKNGMIPLVKNAMLKVKTNITTPAEVLRNAYAMD
jgi:general secretion pathway protein E